MSNSPTQLSLTLPISIRVVWADERVEEMKLETYLAGAVAAEIGTDAPLEALKAQAVASRTYVAAMRRHPEQNADVCTTSHCQRWKRVEPVSAPDVFRALSETWGIVATYEGNPINAFFFEHCDGHTRSAEEMLMPALDYLRGVDCSCGFLAMKGHGIGMCKRGAVGMARRGASFEQILSHYYRGIVVARTGVADHLAPEREVSQPSHVPASLKKPAPPVRKRTKTQREPAAPRRLARSPSPATLEPSPIVPLPPPSKPPIPAKAEPVVPTEEIAAPTEHVAQSPEPTPQVELPASVPQSARPAPIVEQPTESLQATVEETTPIIQPIAPAEPSTPVEPQPTIAEQVMPVEPASAVEEQPAMTLAQVASPPIVESSPAPIEPTMPTPPSVPEAGLPEQEQLPSATAPRWQVDYLPGGRMIAGCLSRNGVSIEIQDPKGNMTIVFSGSAPHYGAGGFETIVETDGAYHVSIDGEEIQVNVNGETAFIYAT